MAVKSRVVTVADSALPQEMRIYKNFEKRGITLEPFGGASQKYLSIQVDSQVIRIYKKIEKKA